MILFLVGFYRTGARGEGGESIQGAEKYKNNTFFKGRRQQIVVLII
jgi:hypothetical protein